MVLGPVGGDLPCCSESFRRSTGSLDVAELVALPSTFTPQRVCYLWMQRRSSRATLALTRSAGLPETLVAPVKSWPSCKSTLSCTYQDRFRCSCQIQSAEVHSGAAGGQLRGTQGCCFDPGGV